jgi:hypothetical protein
MSDPARDVGFSVDRAPSVEVGAPGATGNQAPAERSRLAGLSSLPRGSRTPGPPVDWASMAGSRVERIAGTGRRYVPASTVRRGE